MNKRNLPKNRQLKKLGDIAKVQAGGTPSRSKSEYWKGNIPWLKSGELNDNFFVSKNSEYITQTGLENSSAKLFPKGTLLMAMYGATAGKLGVLGIEASTNQAVCSIQNINGLFDNKYIFHFLWVNRSKIIKDSFGGAQPNISKSYIDNIQIPLPPLATQKAIVAKLDEIFANLDQTKTEIQKSIDAVDEVWKSSLNKVFEEGDWEMKELGEVCEFGPKKSEVKDSVDRKVSFVPMKYVKELEKYFDAEEEKTISEVYKGYTYFKDGDVILAKVTPCFENGKSAIVKGLTNGIGFGSSEFFVLRPNKETIAERIYYLVSSSNFLKKGACNMSGAVGLQRVVKNYILEYPIPLPPLSKQKEIVVHLDQLSNETKQLKSKYQQQLENIEEMRKSVLDQAFKGELI